MHIEARPARGVCVVTVERQPTGPALITLLVVPDVSNPAEATRRYALSATDALDDVAAFLTGLGGTATPPHL